MEIRIRATGQLVSEREFRESYPNVSFPAALSAATLAEWGADPVLAAPAPATTTYQSALRDGAVQDALGNWVQAWTVRDWSADEIAAYDAQHIASVQKATIDAIQDLLDSTAREHGYDDLRSAVTYIGSSVAKWNNEGLRARAWRDECWSKAQAIENAVRAGTRALPTVAEVLAEMPAANWPVA